MTSSFKNALSARIGDMLSACTRCGKCYEVCPITGPAGIDAKPEDVIGGVLDIVRTGDGSAAARTWASSCMLTGDCIKACDYGVNPRFLLAIARSKMAQAANPLQEQRRKGVENFRKVARDVTHLSRMQLPAELLARLGQGATNETADDSEPDFVFYTGCNVLKTPHIALLALDIMDALGASYRVMSGPTHCCGVIQLRTGDIETSGRMAESTLNKLSHSKSRQVVAWCASCHVQFTETTLPTIERARGSRPFEMTPFMLYLHGLLDRLRPMLRHRVDMRIALHRHPGVAGVVDAAQDILRAVPGIEIVDLHQPAVGLMANALAAMPDYKRKLYRDELNAAARAGVDALVAVYHPDHRELCAHEAEYPFRILNLLEIVGQSMGLARPDRYKQLKLMQDVDVIAAECGDMIARHGLNADAVRVAIRSMLADQPVPLTGVGSLAPKTADANAD